MGLRSWQVWPNTHEWAESCTLGVLAFVAQILLTRRAAQREIPRSRGEGCCHPPVINPAPSPSAEACSWRRPPEPRRCSTSRRAPRVCGLGFCRVAHVGHRAQGSCSRCHAPASAPAAAQPTHLLASAPAAVGAGHRAAGGCFPWGNGVDLFARGRRAHNAVGGFHCEHWTGRRVVAATSSSPALVPAPG